MQQKAEHERALKANIAQQNSRKKHKLQSSYRVTNVSNGSCSFSQQLHQSTPRKARVEEQLSLHAHLLNLCTCIFYQRESFQ